MCNECIHQISLGFVPPGGQVPELLRKYHNLHADLSAGSGFCAITRDSNLALPAQPLFGADTMDIHSPWQPPLAQLLEEKHAMGLISDAVMRKICYETT